MGLRQWDAGAAAYARALSLRRELGQNSLALDDLAGLARAMQASGDTSQALQHGQEILDWIASNPPVVLSSGIAYSCCTCSVAIPALPASTQTPCSSYTAPPRESGTWTDENAKGAETKARRIEKSVRQLAAGKKLGCFALTEPQAGSDLGLLRTRWRVQLAATVLDDLDGTLALNNLPGAGAVFWIVSVPAEVGRTRSAIVRSPPAGSSSGTEAGSTLQPAGTVKRAVPTKGLPAAVIRAVTLRASPFFPERNRPLDTGDNLDHFPGAQEVIQHVLGDAGAQIFV